MKNFVKRNTIAGINQLSNNFKEKVLVSKESKKSISTNENEIQLVVKKGGVNFEVKKSNFKVDDKNKENPNRLSSIQTNSIVKDDLDQNRTKSFLCIGGYPAIKKALIERGWVEITDATR